jgi:hypothetical protein
MCAHSSPLGEPGTNPGGASGAIGFYRIFRFPKKLVWRASHPDRRPDLNSVGNEFPELGLGAFGSPFDPFPSLRTRTRLLVQFPGVDSPKIRVRS